MKRLLLLPLLTLLAGVSFSQIDYQIRIDELYSAADDSDGSGDEDPVWKFYLTDDDSGPTNASGCISVTKSYDSWWTGTPLEGPAIPHSWFTRTNCNATMFSTQFEAWEDDACGLTCDFDDNCVFNDDDGHAPVGTSNGTAANTQDINFLTGAPCTYNQYTITVVGDNVNSTPTNYGARISVYWNVSSLDPGVINGDQNLCLGATPAVLGSTDNGTPGNATYGSWFTYQWQEDVGCTGNFSDIALATGSTYSPPAGITQNTCYRRVVKSANCSDAISNEVMITVVPLPDVTVTQSGNQLTATNAGAGVTYQWVDCDNSNAPVAGATSQVFDPTSNGNYAVEVTENGCSDISACFAISSIGIVENEFGSDLKVYPNPTNGAITIDVGEHAKDLKIKMMDLNGRVIVSRVYQESVINMDLDQSSGVYLLELESEGKRAVVRILKN